MTELPKEYGYENGYIHLANLKINDLPPSVEVNNSTMTLKSEFHISLICAKRIAALIDAEEASEVEKSILDTFINFVGQISLTDYSPTNKFRFVERAEKKTVIAMVEVPGLIDFFDILRDKYAKDLPQQPTHITLYTLQPEIGIGILSAEELERDSTEIKVPQLDGLSLLNVTSK